MEKKLNDSKETGEKLLPYVEPYWYYPNAHNPYYNESHHKLRKKVREFVEKELLPYVGQWDEAGEYPIEIHRKSYEAGFYGAPWPAKYGGTPPEGGFDAFHDFILIDELARCACGGFFASYGTIGIALPPILKFGSEELKERIGRPTIEGKKIIALAISESRAGSDVANIHTTARREGDYYIVNGDKKYISSGMKADYFTVAVRTGEPGSGLLGISLLVIEADRKGIKRRRMKTQGWWTGNTTYIIFEDVKVPVKNLIGDENMGFLYIVYNFNHERFSMAVSSNRYARICLEEAITYAQKRRTFGKRLIDHQVIRHKLAEMIRRIESTHAFIETLAFQLQSGVKDKDIGGSFALCKVEATQTFEFCAREASQILGGASYIRGGVGERVERLYREVRVNAIGGGSEEIMRDLAMRQAKL